MSRGVNKVIILGRLGQDPSYVKSAFGNAVSKISVATSEYWKDKNTGEDREATEWHKVVFFGKLADVVNQHLKKGAQVYIEGSLKTNKYTDKQGIERYSTEIHANELQIITWPNDNQQQAQAQSQAPARQQKPENQPLSREEAERIFSESENDDIPF